MLDAAVGPVASAFLGGHHMAPTVEIKTNFMRPAVVGPLFVEPSIVHRTNTVIFLAATKKSEKGRLIPSATATVRIFDWPPASSTSGLAGGNRLALSEVR
nr:PaaI family thioesterase [Bradyrhizobium sp. LCT2]